MHNIAASPAESVVLPLSPMSNTESPVIPTALPVVHRHITRIRAQPRMCTVLVQQMKSDGRMPAGEEKQKRPLS